jgi:hypothetical protein
MNSKPSTTVRNWPITPKLEATMSYISLISSNRAQLHTYLSDLKREAPMPFCEECNN